MTDNVEQGFSGTKAAKIVGISYRQLDYWTRTGLIEPSLAVAEGSGSRRSYSYQDLLQLRMVKTLLDAGIGLASVRKAFGYLRENVTSDITAAHIVISGDTVEVCEGDQLFDVLRRPGQGVLNVLAVAQVKNDVDEQIGPREQPVTGTDDVVAISQAI